MSIAKGGSSASKFYLGGTEVTKIYKGDTLVYGGSSPVLPYDAEVEYLQSDGNQYIDTLIPYDATIVCDAGVKLTANTTGQYILGIYVKNSDESVWRWSVNDANNRLRPHFGTNTSTSIQISVSMNAWLTLHADYRYLTVGTKTVDSKATSFIPDEDATIAIFGRHNYNHTTDVESFSNGQKCAYSYFKLTVDNALVLDMIPVRKDGVGYMYDKVSGNLFGNVGTGTFTYGSDVV